MDTKGIIALISDVRASANRFLIEELNKHNIKGLAPSHGAILSHLFTNEAVTMKDLAKAVRRDKSTVTALIAKLVSNGYISKETNIHDQRSTEVHLTRKGEELRSVFLEISENLLRRAWKGIDETEQKEVIRILQKIRSNYD
jgi:DNA-binding MarR family transcriptional regulator